MMRIFLRYAGLLGAVMGMLPFYAFAEPSPEQIVQMLYVPYLKSARPDSAPDAEMAVINHAATRLKKQLEYHRECEEDTSEICSFDFDIIVDGQDWQLSGLKIQKSYKSSSKAIVTSDFLNGGEAHHLRYFFIRENHRWKIADMESGSPATPRHWKLSQLLAAVNSGN